MTLVDLVFDSKEEEIFFEPFQKFGIRLFFKRDDLIHPFISGNKWRKLKYHLRHAQQHNKQHLVTFGGAFSNHLLATAAAASKFKFKSTAFVRGESVSNDTLSLCRLFGMKLIFVDRELYKNKPKLFLDYFSEDLSAYFIDEGGAGELGELGCREIITELKNSYHHIFCAAGTGTTAAGIINAVNLSSAQQSQIHIVSSLKGNFLKPEIEKQLLHPYPFILHDDYHFGGYAKTNTTLINFIKDFISKTGILIDPVYTAKCLFAILDLAKKEKIKQNESVLMIHTGGIFGILGMTEKFM